MLCLKGKIHRKILVTLKFQEDVRVKIKMYKLHKCQLKILNPVPSSESFMTSFLTDEKVPV